MAQEYFVATQLLVALALAGLAGFLLYLDFGNRIHRAFSLFLFLRAGVILLTQLTRLESGLEGLFVGVRGYLLLATPFALVNLFVVYNWRQSTVATRVVRVATLATLVALLAVYSQDHTLLDDKGPNGKPVTAPFTVLAASASVLISAFAVWFALASTRSDRTVRAKFYYLLGLGFMSAAFAEGSVAWAVLLRAGLRGFSSATPIPTLDALQIVVLLTPVPVALIAVAFLMRASRRAPLSQSLPWTIGLALVSFALPFLATFLSSDGPLWLLLGLVRLLFPAIVGYAIARQAVATANPFALDAAAKVTISRGTLGGIFLAAFFAFSEVASDKLQDVASKWNVDPVWGQVIGALAALAFLLLLHPVRVLGERMSQSALPRARPLSQLNHSEREHLYREQLALAWEDGALSRKERLLLDQLRDRLHISSDVAQRLERHAVSGGPA